MGAAEGCGDALQASCLEGFDTPGLHQLQCIESFNHGTSIQNILKGVILVRHVAKRSGCVFLCGVRIVVIP